MRLRRLDSEQIRDAILATSGTLCRSVGGPPLLLDTQSDGAVVVKSEGLESQADAWRRSIYVLARRNYQLSMLSVFDQPIVTGSCTLRKSAPVVTQSLALLNDDFVVRQAEFFAARVLAEAGNDSPRRQLETAFLLALGRLPDAQDVSRCIAFLDRQSARFSGSETEDDPQAAALVHLCQMLFNASEFLYVQ
jgi:hypothetical protein